MSREEEAGPTADDLMDLWHRLSDQGEPPSLEDLTRDAPEDVCIEVRRRVADFQAAREALDGLWRIGPVDDGFEPLGKPGRYELLRRIDEGGMGILCLARDAELERDVAYKVMKPKYQDDPSARRKFLNEAILTADLRHPGIVPILGLVEDDAGLPAYAMELVDGVTLAVAIHQYRAMDPGARQPRRERRAKLLGHFTSLCRIVAYAHQQGVVHGDVKPLNVLVDREFDATWLIDWGLAHVIEPRGPGEANGHAADGPVVGTRAYQSPSVLDGGPASFASDLYALGVTLALLLAAPAEETAASSPRPAPDTPAALWAVAEKAMHPERDSRYVSANDLARDVEEALADRPIAAYRDPLSTRLRRWIGRHRAAAIGTSATALALIAVVVVYLVNSRDAALAAAHVAAVHSAQGSAGRGDWPAALRDYRRAIEDRRDDATRLRVERLFGFFAVNDSAILESELDSLGGRQDLGPLAAQVALVRGAYLLCDLDSQEEGRKWVREALRSRDDLATFSAAGPEFAEALAETRPIKVLEHLRRAVRLDPLHFAAHSSLLMAYVTIGELAEARRQCDQMQGLFPEAPMVDFARAAADLIEGKRDGMRRNLDSLARRLGPRKAEAMAALRPYCESLADLLDVANNFNVTSQGFTWVDNLRIGMIVSQTQTKMTPALRPFVLPLPTVGLLFRTPEAVFDIYRQYGIGGDDASLARLMALGEETPEALVRVLMAANRLQAVIGVVNRAELVTAREVLSTLSRVSQQAAVAPTMIPRSPIRYQSRIVGAIADASLLKLTPKPDPEVEPRLRENLRQLVGLGRKWPSDREIGFDFLLQMIVVPMTKEQARAWKPETPQGAESLRQRQESLRRFAQALVYDWIADRPDSKLALSWRTKLETHAFGLVGGK